MRLFATPFAGIRRNTINPAPDNSGSGFSCTLIRLRRPIFTPCSMTSLPRLEQVFTTEVGGEARPLFLWPRLPTDPPSD